MKAGPDHDPQNSGALEAQVEPRRIVEAQNGAVEVRRRVVADSHHSDEESGTGFALP